MHQWRERSVYLSLQTASTKGITSDQFNDQLFQRSLLYLTFPAPPTPDHFRSIQQPVISEPLDIFCLSTSDQLYINGQYSNYPYICWPLQILDAHSSRKRLIINISRCSFGAPTTLVIIYLQEQGSIFTELDDVLREETDFHFCVSLWVRVDRWK